MHCMYAHACRAFLQNQIILNMSDHSVIAGTNLCLHACRLRVNMTKAHRVAHLVVLIDSCDRCLELNSTLPRKGQGTGIVVSETIWIKAEKLIQCRALVVAPCRMLSI